LEVAEGLVDLEDEWGGEGIEGLGAVDLDLDAWVKYYFPESMVMVTYSSQRQA
jgi:hypothetical protein